MWQDLRLCPIFDADEFMSEIVGENIFVVENLCSRSENTQSMMV